MKTMVDRPSSSPRPERAPSPRPRWNPIRSGRRDPATIEPPHPEVESHALGGLFSTSESHALPTTVPPTPPAPDDHGRKHREPAEPSVLKDPDFRLLWTSRLFVQTAQGALLYALLIMVVDLSNKSIYNSLFVICSNIPSLVFGLAAGVVADNLPRKFLLVSLNGYRFLFMLFLVGTNPSLPGVFAATLGIWIIHQFYSPTEASMLAEIVPARRYTAAQASFNLALTISQGIGMVVTAPVLLRLGGPKIVFVAAGALYLMAAALTALLPSSRPDIEKVPKKKRPSLARSLGNGWRFVRGDRPTFQAIVDDVLVSVGMSALIVIVPFYLERVLGTSKENTVFVFAPAALGLVAGLRLAPLLGRLFTEQVCAAAGLGLFALCIIMLGFVNATFRLLTQTLHIPLDDLSNLLGVPPLVLVAMVVSIPAGFASAVVNVAARSVLLHRTPSVLRGQVIATQGMIGNAVSFVPTLMAGIAMDIFGVTPIAIAIGVGIVAIAIGAHFYNRHETNPVFAAHPG